MRLEREGGHIRVWFDHPGPWVVRMQAGVRMSQEESEAQPTLFWSDGVSIQTEHVEITTHDAFYDAHIGSAWVARFLIVSPDSYRTRSGFWADMSEFI